MKLLNKTIRSYLLVSILLLIIFIPFFYITIEYLFLREMDRMLRSHAQDFQTALPYLDDDKNRHFFLLVNREFSLQKLAGPAERDQIYSHDSVDSRTGENTEYRVLRTVVKLGGQDHYLFIRESMVPGTTLIGVITIVQTSLLVLLAASLVLINRNLSLRIWSPFYVILERLRKYQIDRDKAPDLPPMPTEELREMSEVITQLIGKSHEAFQSQKEFTENASHELQTPLAICRTKLELLAQTRELTQEQAELVEALLDTTDRINRLNKNLLLLSKIENRQFIEKEQINLQKVVPKVIGAFAQYLEGQQLRFESTFRGPGLVTGNPILVEALIGNLISNAMRHSPRGGEIGVLQDGNHLVIQNSGDEMSNPEKLFDRFHRGSRTSSGSGLGLSIAKRIAEVSGYQLSYKYHEGQHFFTVVF